MRQRRDYKGARFGHVVLRKFIKFLPNGDQYWECECDCGNVFQRGLRTMKAFPENQSCRECEYGHVGQAPNYVTTPLQIQEEAAAIRAEWTPKEYRSRRDGRCD